MRIILSVGFVGVAAGVGYLLYRAIRARWGRWALGRFFALCVGFSLFGIGAEGSELLTADHGIVELGGRFSRYPMYYRASWLEVVTVGVACGLVLAVILFLREEWTRRRGAHAASDVAADIDADAAEWPPEYVAAILAAERQSTSQQCAHVARRLQREATRSHRRLPPELKAFVHRYLESSA